MARTAVATVKQRVLKMSRFVPSDIRATVVTNADILYNCVVVDGLVLCVMVDGLVLSVVMDGLCLGYPVVLMRRGVILFR